MLGINTVRGPARAKFGLAALPGRERDFEALFRQALDYITAIGGSAIHCMAGNVPPEQRPAAETVFIRNLTRAADAAARAQHHAADRADQSARPAGLFPQPRRARRRHHRQGRRAERAHPVRFLSCADRRRRSDPRLRKAPAAHRPRADRRGAVARRAGRGRDQLSGICSRRSIASATRAGSAANTVRARRPRTGSAGRSLMASRQNNRE